MTTSTQTHGHVNAYKAGCRCAECREANTDYQRAAQARRAQDPAGADRAGHGKRTTYVNWSCRCLPCCDASSTAQRITRHRRKERAK